MKYPDPIRQILFQSREYWDGDKTRPAVRWAFTKALQCRTAELGAEVYASAKQERIVYHTCKSPTCPSCGYRATLRWARERWAALPEVPYKGITFTMPDVLWVFFRDNRHLARALPALAAKIIQVRASARCGLRIGVTAILHTFNGQLEFNSHVHTMVTGGGLRRSSSTWLPHVYYNPDQLMTSWRRAVIKLLRAAVKAGQLQTDIPVDQVEAMLAEQEQRWWSIKIQTFNSKEHFLRYAGRYVRRPPIAQRRITHIGSQTVRFWYKDKRRRRRVEVQCSTEEFIDRWSQHVPDRYHHAVRSFGLFAPRALAGTSLAIFAILRQRKRPRPRPRRWAESLKRDFGRDPLVDKAGEKMKWTRRLTPQ